MIMVNFTHPIVSSDSHIVEPPTLWTERIDKKYRDRAPRTKMGHNGNEGEYFTVEGIEPWPVVRLFAPGIKSEDMPEYHKNTFKVAPASTWDPAARLKEQDADGIKAEILFTSFGLFLYGLQDPDFRRACFRVYNDYMAEYCRHDPNRLVGVAMIILDDIELAVAELTRCAKLGLRGGMIWSRAPEDKPYVDRHYDPFWAAAEETGMILTMHIHTASQGFGIKPGHWLAEFTTMTTEIQHSLTELVLSGVFERHPNLRVVSAENDCGWMPHLMHRLDHNYDSFRHVAEEMKGIKLSMPPSAYLKRNVGVTFQHEKAEVKYVREFMGPNAYLMWGSDYPHNDGTWPDSRKILAEAFRDLPAADTAKLVGGNAARLYNIQLAS